mmetsp:Transcript_81937/g.147907  ORF Transcript_81937/g.147907 Transcript_81937/m.147907 type:complete len:118 (-) Transcript_81937:754-1107(-)
MADAEAGKLASNPPMGGPPAKFGVGDPKFPVAQDKLPSRQKGEFRLGGHGSRDTAAFGERDEDLCGLPPKVWPPGRPGDRPERLPPTSEPAARSAGLTGRCPGPGDREDAAGRRTAI